MSAAQDSVTRQTIIKDIFNRFFQKAFPKLRDKLGIIYTPVEVVDFINRSVADLLKKEFNQSVGTHGIHVLDPFTGTGTFIVRMMESGLIPKDQLKYKYENNLHANEIVPLAYYIASMNIETAYHNLVDDKDYRPNNVTVWTDTFASNGKANLITALSENNDNLCRENNAEIRIIVGNPPYSVGQESQNDNNANEILNLLLRKYRTLPDDYRIVGFDNSSISREALMTISTVGQPISQIAREAVQLLHDQITKIKKSKTGAFPAPVHKVVTPVLYRRETTEGVPE